MYAFSGTRTVKIEVKTEEPETIETTPQKEESVKVIYRDGNLPQRNNNPLNITYGRATKHWVEEKKAEIAVTKRGQKFLRFNTPELGFEAAGELLSNSYGTYTVDAMLDRWTNNGYRFNDNRIINSLTKSEKDDIIYRMAVKEGYYAK